MLTEEEVSFLLKLLSRRVVVEPSVDFPFWVSKASPSYRDGMIGRLRAKLSAMAEAKRRAREIRESGSGDAS